MADPEVILLKSELFKVGGLEKNSNRLAQAFVDRGCRVKILTTSPIAPINNFHAELIPFDIGGKMSYLQAIRFADVCDAYLRRSSAQVILGLDRNWHQTHLRAGNGVHAAFLKQRVYDTNLLKRISFSLNPLHRTLLALEKTAFEDPRLRILFVNSHMVRSEVIEHYKVSPEKIRVIHNGVEWHEMQEDFDLWETARPSLMRSSGLDPSAFQFLFIGNNYCRKGLTPLLHALAEMKNEPFQLSVVGKEKNQAKFQYLAHSLGIGRKVFFFGPQKETRPFYQIADALVIPSFYDPFANVTLEAMAMGVFVLSSPFNGGHELLNEKTGITLPVIDSIDLFTAYLKKTLNHRKRTDTAKMIRAEALPYDYCHPLKSFTDLCLQDILPGC